MADRSYLGCQFEFAWVLNFLPITNVEEAKAHHYKLHQSLLCCQCNLAAGVHHHPSPSAMCRLKYSSAAFATLPEAVNRMLAVVHHLLVGVRLAEGGG